MTVVPYSNTNIAYLHVFMQNKQAVAEIETHIKHYFTKTEKKLKKPHFSIQYRSVAI